MLISTEIGHDCEDMQSSMQICQEFKRSQEALNYTRGPFQAVIEIRSLEVNKSNDMWKSAKSLLITLNHELNFINSWIGKEIVISNCLQ